MTIGRDRQDKRETAECSCNHGWVCEEHSDQPWEHDNCGGAGERCKNPNCTKDPDSIIAKVQCSLGGSRRGSRSIKSLRRSPTKRRS